MEPRVKRITLKTKVSDICLCSSICYCRYITHILAWRVVSTNSLTSTVIMVLARWKWQVKVHCLRSIETAIRWYLALCPGRDHLLKSLGEIDRGFEAELFWLGLLWPAPRDRQALSSITRHFPPNIFLSGLTVFPIQRWRGTDSSRTELYQNVDEMYS